MKKKKIQDKNLKEENNKEETIIEDTNNDFGSSTIESSLESSFFYTNDKFINQLDNNEIFQFIQTKYPLFNINNDDPIIKKQLTFILDDDIFVQRILKYFNLTIFEFFSILYKQFSAIFKGPYLKKLKNILSEKKYAINARKKHDY